MQHISIQLNNENGNIVETSNINFAEIMERVFKEPNFNTRYPFLTTIDQYGDTTFNILQIPSVVKELESLQNSDESILKDKISFLSKINTHFYIKFIGD